MTEQTIKNTIGGLSEGDVLCLTCPRCNNQLQFTTQQLLKVSRPYKPLATFAASHTCAICWQLGAHFELVERLSKNDSDYV